MLDAKDELWAVIQGNWGLTMALLSHVAVLSLRRPFEDCVPNDESNDDTEDVVWFNAMGLRGHI